MLHPHSLFAEYREKIGHLEAIGREGILNSSFALYEDENPLFFHINPIIKFYIFQENPPCLSS